MYRTIEGMYDKGRIIPLEDINDKNKKYRVIITMLEQIKEKEEDLTNSDTEYCTLDIKKLTMAYLNEGIERRGSIRDIKLDSKEIENYLINAFGTDDPVEIINMLRR